MEYTHEYSQFPNKVMQRHNFKDADDSVANVINQINSLKNQGLYNQANRILEQNKDVLGQYALTSEHCNAIDEETRNLEIKALQVQQSIYIQTEEPDSAALGDVWIE